MDKSINLIKPSLLAVFITCYVMRIILATSCVNDNNVNLQRVDAAYGTLCCLSFSFSLRVIYIHYTRFIMIK